MPRGKFERTDSNSNTKSYHQIIQNGFSYWNRILRTELKALNIRLKQRYGWEDAILEVGTGSAGRLDGSKKNCIKINNLENTKLSQYQMVHIFQGIKDSCSLTRRKYTQQRSRLMRCNIKIPANNILDKYRKQYQDTFFKTKQLSNGNGYIVPCKDKIHFFVKRFYNRTLTQIENCPEKSLSLDQIIPTDTFFIKLAGDGCKLTNTHSNVFNFTFTIMNDIENSMSVNGNYVLAMSRVEAESYEQLLETLEDILDELKQLNTITIDEKIFNLEFIGGGDMKYVRTVLGLDSSCSHYCCFYCTCDFTKPIDFENGYKINRSHEESISSYLKKTKDEKKGYVKNPIINFIEHKNIVFCHLHMFSRIFEQLFNILFMKINEKDKRNDSIDFKKHRPNLTILYNFLLTKCKINKPFTINEKKKEINLRKNLTKNDKMKILKRFFDIDENDQVNYNKLDNEKSSLITIFPNIDLRLENAVFKSFVSLDFLLTNYLTIPLDLGAFQSRLREWLKAYNQLNVKQPGLKEITPYLHVWVFHSVELLVLHGDIHIYTGQGLEKFNDIVKKYYSSMVVKKYDKPNEKGCISQLIDYINRLELDREGVTFEELRHKLYG